MELSDLERKTLREFIKLRWLEFQPIAAKYLDETETIELIRKLEE